jgi:diaminopimelate epimerase
MRSAHAPTWLRIKLLQFKEKSHVLTRLFSRGLMSVLICGLGACATVAPYERERLARPDMEVGRNADAKAGEEHATAYREGSSGGMGSSGGGCGCN